MVQKNSVRSRVRSIIAAGLILLGGIVTSVLHPNQANADDLPVTYVSGTLTEDTIWTPNTVYISSGVIVPDDVTLTIQPGAIVKAGNFITAITVNAGGILEVNGSSSSPVSFTGNADDSLGGDSNNDGQSTAYAGSYNGAILAYGATVNVDHAHFKYASTAIDGSGTSFHVHDSDFSAVVSGISVSGADAVDIGRNNFAAEGSNPAVSLSNVDDVTGMSLDGTNQNTFTGNAVRRSVSVSNSEIPANTSWDVSGLSGVVLKSTSLAIKGTMNLNDDVVYAMPTGFSWIEGAKVSGTLNISPGVTVKYADTNGIILESGGTLNAQGTSLEPIVFTSYGDDSVGGDTNNDGSSAGYIGQYSSAILAYGGSVQLAHTVFHYASTAVSGGSSQLDISVEDSNFVNTASGIHLNNVDTINLVRNHFDVDSNNGLAISVYDTEDVTGIVLSGANKNTFEGNANNRSVVVSDSYVPENAVWDISGGANHPILRSSGLTVDGELSLESGSELVLDASQPWVMALLINGALNMNAGSVVKYGYLNNGIVVRPGGVLNAQGTSTSPVRFTSLKDDTVNGDTNNNGPSTAAVDDYSTAITVSNGTANIDHADFKYGYSSISQSGATSVIDITSSKFTANNLAVSLSSTGQLYLENNQFDVGGNGKAISVYGVDDLTGIALSGNNKNTFIGNHQNSTVEARESYVPAGKTWLIDRLGSNAVLRTQAVTINGALHMDNDSVLLMDTNFSGVIGLTINGSLTVDQGSIVKCKGMNACIAPNSSSSLSLVGTSTDPVIFTSYKDDSYGGDSNADGNNSQPSAGDYSVAISGSFASVEVANTHFHYGAIALNMAGTSNLSMTDGSISDYSGAAVSVFDGQAELLNVSIANTYQGLSVSGDAEVIYRGGFDNITNKSIAACNWIGSCHVDATYVDWGDASGPHPSGGWKACGSVVTNPWKYGSTTHNGSFVYTPNCDGSPTPDQLLDGSIDDFKDSMDAKQIDCSGGYQPACDAMETAMACLGGAVNVAASTSPIPLPEVQTNGDIDDFSTDINTSSVSAVTGAAISEVTPSTPRIKTLIGQLIGTFGALSSAYGGCAP